MKTLRLALALVFVLHSASPMLGQAQEIQKPPIADHPYASLAMRVETRLRFVTDFSFPGGPAVQIKVYDWVIGPRQEFSTFPLEGFATIEVKAGEVETTIDGTTTGRHEGEHWVVPEGKRLSIRVRSELGRGDNVVSLRGVVVIRK